MGIGCRIIVFQIGIGFFGAEIHNLKKIVMNTEMEKCAYLYSGVIGMLKMNENPNPPAMLGRME